LAGGLFAFDLIRLTWDRYAGKERISEESYKHRVAASFLTNGASYLGGSIGAGIGCFIGNLFCPGLGGYIGSMIGNFVGGAAASLSVEYLMGRKDSNFVEREIEPETTDETKAKGYIEACNVLEVHTNSTKNSIVKAARYKFL
jgi:uncharacterized protein YcfJ